MNTIVRPPSGIPLAPAAPKELSETAPQSAVPRTTAGEVHAGTGALQGRQVSVGTSQALPQPAPASVLPHAVQKATQGVELQTPQGPAARQATMQRPAARAQPTNSTAALYVPRPGSLATNPAVLKALQAHAKAVGTVLTPKEIAGYVALGEHAVHAIQQPSTALARGLGKTFVNTLDPPVVLRPNMETARGISWYVAACAAQQDVNQQATGSNPMVNGKEITSLTTKGAYVFKDPGNAVYNFMQSSPLTYSRISTHFNERSASTGMIGSRPEQRGVEDYDRRLPGQNGAILFDKLKGGEMFIKFEGTGFPEVLTSSKRVDDQGKGGASAWQSLLRKIGHAVSFVRTRFAGGQGVDRKEHVVKGLLKSPVHEPFMAVVRTAQKLGLATGMDPAAHEKQAKKMGLPHLEATLAQLLKTIDAQPQPSAEQLKLLYDVTQVQAAITMAKAELGAQSDHLGIERRGAETHIDLKPPRAHLDVAHKEFVTLEPGLRSPQGLLESYDPGGSIMGEHTIPAGVNFTAVKDWNRNGIAVNFTVYPGQGKAGNVSSHQTGITSTLEQGCSAFVQACGNSPVAAEWISRFAHQGLSVPMLQYLEKESLGTVGAGVLVSSGSLTFSINTLPNGSVDVTMNYHYQNSAEDPKPLLIGGELTDMHDEARLSATVTLRFDDVSTYTSTQVPVPVISAPLVYTTSHFSPA